jgi:hypothetical protein
MDYQIYPISGCLQSMRWGYQEQIAEMERFMKQTWEDKERDTQKHEETAGDQSTWKKMLTSVANWCKLRKFRQGSGLKQQTWEFNQ